MVRFPAWIRDIYRVHTDTGAHPSSYSMATRGGERIPGCKTVGGAKPTTYLHLLSKLRSAVTPSFPNVIITCREANLAFTLRLTFTNRGLKIGSKVSVS